MQKMLCCVLLALLAVVPWATAALAQDGGERVLSFDSDITVNPDASMDVTETIRVLAQGFQIKHGIYRDFPTVYKTSEGHRVEVGFSLREVRRDGAPEPYETERGFNGVRVRIGDADVYVEPGEHTYTIMYHTTRQLGFFAGFDELYWNVTGNGWDMPMDRVSARVSLPPGISAADLKTTAYTGGYGAHGVTYTAESSDSLAQFVTTAPLPSYEGLTIVVQWPAGQVQRPTALQRNVFLLTKFLAAIFALLGLIVATIYYIQAWRRVGVDPPAGFITPRETPPNELSPAALRYVMRMGQDNKGFTAALVSLASKGALSIEETDKHKYTLTKLAQATLPLAQEEEMLQAALFSEGDKVEASKDNWQLLAGAQAALRKSLSQLVEGVYFQRNTGELLKGIGLSVVCWLFTLAGLLVYPSVLSISSFMLGTVCFIALNVIFALLIPKYTMVGRGLLDGIEGFKLALAGGMDEYGDQHAGSRTLTEQYLPYAIALEVHTQWSRRFERAMDLQRAKEQGPNADLGFPAYLPSWYIASSGMHTHSYNSFANFTTNFTSTLDSTISAASTPPGSSNGSGGGGGGFSGGGGGGGGGGGW